MFSDVYGLMLGCGVCGWSSVVVLLMLGRFLVCWLLLHGIVISVAIVYIAQIVCFMFVFGYVCDAIYRCVVVV